MPPIWTAIAAVFPCLALALGGCAAERLEARSPERGPSAASAPTVPVARPTNLQASERQLAAPEPAPATTPTTIYTCPMHPAVESPTPGECPKCGMRLEPKGRAP